MAKAVFITATGTDVGKTYISSLIVKKMKELSKNICYYKPVLSGAIKKDGELYAGDVEYVKEVSLLKEDTLNMVSFVYEYPASPHLSSRLEKKFFNMEKCRSDFNNLSNKYDYILVEGAGGIICPLYYENKKLILLEDIIKELSLSVILVSSCGLGAVNNALLSIEYIRSKNIGIEGIIFNNYEGSLIEQDNIEFIQEVSSVPVLSVVKKGDGDINIENIEKIFLQVGRK